MSGAKPARSGLRSIGGGQYIGNLPPSELRDVYEVECHVHLINLENRSANKVPSVGVTMYCRRCDPNWETATGKAIGKQVGSGAIPLEGCFDADGKDAVLSQAVPLGIDGVLEIPTR